MRLKTRYALFSIISVSVIITFLLSGIYLFHFEEVVITKPNEHNVAKRSLEVVDKPICETIHVGIVCPKQELTVDFYVLLKSIFLYRNNPLHFHIIVNNMTQKIIERLISTWNINQVTITYYNIETIKLGNQIQENLDVMKLLFPKLLPLNGIQKIIVLSTNFVFNEDIYELWDEFNDFEPNQILGMTINYFPKHWSSQYGDERPNTDILLYHVENLRRFGIDRIWNKIKHRPIFDYNEYAQKNIILNILQSADLIRHLPCTWNTKRRSSGCISTSKVAFQKSSSDYSVYVYNTFVKLNGNFVQKNNYMCNPNYSKPKTVVKLPNDPCFEFPETESWQRRTFLYFYEYNYIHTDSDVTLVSQLSISKLRRLEEIARRWYGPMSLALYVTDAEFHTCIEFIENSAILQSRNNIGYHAVFKDGGHHVTNVLRNLALSEVNSPYVFLNDIYLIPVENLHLTLKMHLSNIAVMDKKALVVPAFETREPDIKLPKNMNSFLKMLDNKHVFVFQEDTRVEGHKQTNYNKWKTTKTSYKVSWKDKYEPYIVVQKNVTKYDERFFAYGWNKISHIMELEAQKYDFIVLPNIFVVHQYHGNSHDKSSFLKNENYKMCLKSLKENHANELYKKYGRKFEIE